MSASAVAVSLLEDPLLQAFTFLVGSSAIVRIVRRNRSRGKAETRPAARATGFRGLKWGEGPRPEMTLYHDGLVEKLFTRRGDSLLLGAARLKSIVYAYHLGRLQAVMIELPRRETATLVAQLVHDWGEPRVLGAPDHRKRYWTELGSGADAMQAVFDEAASPQAASLILTSKRIAEQRGWSAEIRAPRPAALRHESYAMAMEVAR